MNNKLNSVSSSPTWSATAHTVLRIAFLIRCFGLGAKYLWHPFEADSTVFSTLFFEFGFSEPAAQRVDDAGMWAMVFAGVIVMLLGDMRVSPRRSHVRWLPWLESLILLFAIVWELLLAGTKTYRGGELMSQWTIAEHGLRIATPIALLVLSVSMTGLSRWGQPVERLLQIATAVTFAAHGIKAWIAAPAFITMVIATCQNLFDYWPEQSDVEIWLKVICAADLIVAVLIVCSRWPRVAMYAAAWGLITALGRFTSSDLGWPECLLRSVHVGGPLFLYLQWRYQTGRTRSDSVDDATPEN